MSFTVDCLFMEGMTFFGLVKVIVTVLGCTSHFYQGSERI